MASPALAKYSWRCQDKGCRGNRISCHLWCRRKDHRAFYPQKNVCLLLTRTKRKVKANLLFPVKLLQKAAESIVLHCQEGTAVPVCQHHVRTKFPALLMALGSEPFVSQEKGSTTYSHPGGLRAPSLCALKPLCCQILTGTKERSSSPVSGSYVTGTALHWEHSGDSGLAGGMYGAAIEEPPKPRRSQILCYSLS